MICTPRLTKERGRSTVGGLSIANYSILSTSTSLTLSDPSRNRLVSPQVVTVQLKALKVFCDVVEQRSFSEAAADNGVSQSAASQMVSHVEEEMGAKFIDRSQRPIALLPAGEVFYKGCRRIVDQFEGLRNQLHDYVASESGQINVASIYSVGLSHMNWCVRQFLQNSPDSNVRVEYRHPDQVYQLVERGQAQIGLVSYPRDSRSVDALAWREEQIAVACSPNHPFADRSSLKLTELHGQPLVGYDERLRIWTEIDRAFLAAGVETNVVVRFDNTETIKRAVEIDAGIGLLPSPTLDREVAAGTLCRVPLESPGLVRPVGIIVRRGKPLSDEASRFVEFLLANRYANESEDNLQLGTAASSSDSTAGADSTIS